MKASRTRKATGIINNEAVITASTTKKGAVEMAVKGRRKINKVSGKVVDLSREELRKAVAVTVVLPTDEDIIKAVSEHCQSNGFIRKELWKQVCVLAKTACKKGMSLGEAVEKSYDFVTDKEAEAKRVKSMRINLRHLFNEYAEKVGYRLPLEAYREAYDKAVEAGVSDAKGVEKVWKAVLRTNKLSAKKLARK